jgi:hypothetical protein
MFDGLPIRSASAIPASMIVRASFRSSVWMVRMACLLGQFGESCSVHAAARGSPPAGESDVLGCRPLRYFAASRVNL